MEEEGGREGVGKEVRGERVDTSEEEDTFNFAFILGMHKQCPPFLLPYHHCTATVLGWLGSFFKIMVTM